MRMNDFFQNLLQPFLSDKEIHLKLQLVFRNATVYEAQILRKNLIEKESSQCGIYISGNFSAILHLLRRADGDLRLQGNVFILICKDCLVYIMEEHTFAARSRSLLGQVVNTENHILRRNRYRTSVRRLQKVVRGEQQESALCLSLY